MSILLLNTFWYYFFIFLFYFMKSGHHVLKWQLRGLSWILHICHMSMSIVVKHVIDLMTWNDKLLNIYVPVTIMPSVIHETTTSSTTHNQYPPYLWCPTVLCFFCFSSKNNFKFPWSSIHFIFYLCHQYLSYNLVCINSFILCANTEPPSFAFVSWC